MNKEDIKKLKKLEQEKVDLEVIRDLLQAVIDLNKYTSRFNDAQKDEYLSHVSGITKETKLCDESHIKYHLTCARRILESARDWEF